jgi:hypothetical protein
LSVHPPSAMRGFRHDSGSAAIAGGAVARAPKVKTVMRSLAVLTEFLPRL